MNQKIMSYIPKTKIEAIRDAYKDEDGYWISLNEGWEASRTDSGCRTIHEDTIKDLRYQIAGIQRIEAQEIKTAEEAQEIKTAEEAAQQETVYETQEEHEQRVRETAPEILAVAGIMAELKAKLEEEPEQKENKEAFEGLPVIDTKTGETITENAAEIVGRNEAAKQKTEPEAKEAEEGTEEQEPEGQEAAEQEPEGQEAKEREAKQEQESEPEGQEPEKNLLATQEHENMVTAEKIPFEGYGAAEVVGFGVMLSFAFVWWIARGTIELLISALSMLIYRVWTDREKTKNTAKQITGMAWRTAKKTVKWTAATVRTVADNLPTAGSIKAISVIARMVILAVGLMAII